MSDIIYVIVLHVRVGRLPKYGSPQCSISIRIVWIHLHLPASFFVGLCTCKYPCGGICAHYHHTRVLSNDSGKRGRRRFDCFFVIVGAKGMRTFDKRTSHSPVGTVSNTSHFSSIVCSLMFQNSASCCRDVILQVSYFGR